MLYISDWQIQLHTHAHESFSLRLYSVEFDDSGVSNIPSVSPSQNIFIHPIRINKLSKWKAKAILAHICLWSASIPQHNSVFLQPWANNNGVEFVSARLRKIRYHVFPSAWCQPLRFEPKRIIPVQHPKRGSAKVQMSATTKQLSLSLFFSFCEGAKWCLFAHSISQWAGDFFYNISHMCSRTFISRISSCTM